MSSIATRFIAQIRRNAQSWRAREIDYDTFTASQRSAWAGVRAAGRHVEAEVMGALRGTTQATDVLMLEGSQQRTVQLPVRRAPPPPPARRYRALIERTVAGSPMLKVLAADSRSEHAEPRQVAALIYEIAADMERRSQQLEAHWAITADPENGQLVIELTGEHEADLADELVANVMTERQLI